MDNYNYKLADVNHDTVVDIKDVIALLSNIQEK